MNRLALLFLAALALAGCDNNFGIRGDRNVVSQQRAATDFTVVRADGAFTIEWQPSATPTVTITADSNLQQYVEVTNEGGELHLRTRENLRPSHGITAKIGSARLSGAKLHGACKLEATQISGDSFGIESAGASRVTLDGAVNRLVTDMTGASRLDADDLKTRSAEMSLTGASRADVTVSDELRVNITGAGRVTYRGNPQRVEKNVSGAGKISARD